MKKLAKMLNDYLCGIINKRMERKLDKAFAPINKTLDDTKLKLLLIVRLQSN